MIRQAIAGDDEAVMCEMDSMECGVYISWYNLPFNVNRCFQGSSIVEEFIDTWEVQPGIGIVIHLPDWFFAEQLYTVAA